MEVSMTAKSSSLRIVLKALAAIGLVGTLGLTATSDGFAADLRVSTNTRRAHVIHHTPSRLVRDYDGTPILLRPRFAVLRGTVISDGPFDAYLMMRALPPYYLNGQPVRTAYIRGVAAF